MNRQIEYQSYHTEQEPVFSILVPSWNNLAYLKLCVASIRQHSAHEHQIILHINDGSDGSRTWAHDEELDHSYSEENVGVCLAVNAAATLARTDYIVYLNDDMYVLPDWDRYLMEEIKRIGHERFFLSGTMIEPSFTNNRCVLAPHDFGRNREDFREDDILAEFKKLTHHDWNGATWPPNVVHRSVWEEVGGYSVEFSPGMSSDPDFSRKLWQAGVRYFKGLGNSRVYHFQAKSTGKIRKNPGGRQFLKKWGLTQSTFGRYYLRLGQRWNGPLSEPRPGPGFMLARLKSGIKRLLI